MKIGEDGFPAERTVEQEDVRKYVCVWCVRVCVGGDFDECVLTDGVTPLSLPPPHRQHSCHGWISRSNHLSFLFHTARTQRRLIYVPLTTQL